MSKYPQYFKVLNSAGAAFALVCILNETSIVAIENRGDDSFTVSKFSSFEELNDKVAGKAENITASDFYNTLFAEWNFSIYDEVTNAIKYEVKETVDAEEEEEEEATEDGLAEIAGSSVEQPSDVEVSEDGGTAGEGENVAQPATEPEVDSESNPEPISNTEGTSPAAEENGATDGAKSDSVETGAG